MSELLKRSLCLGMLLLCAGFIVSCGSDDDDSDSPDIEEPDPDAVTTAGELRDFLWKPKAESDYNKGSLVIHVGPCNATVYVAGAALLDYGPGNGRCNTSRAYKPGCAFGNQVKVEVKDNATGLPYTYQGLPYVIVPAGCDRYEFKY